MVSPMRDLDRAWPARLQMDNFLRKLDFKNGKDGLSVSAPVDPLYQVRKYCGSRYRKNK